MDKRLYLTVARSALNERMTRREGHTRCVTLDAFEASANAYENLIGQLNNRERSALLQSLSTSLEKERRRCKARKWNYDAGRHISLYVAVKTLAENEAKPRSERPGL